MYSTLSHPFHLHDDTDLFIPMSPSIVLTGQSLRSGSLCKPGSMLGYSGLGGSTLYTDDLYNTPEGGSPRSLGGSCSSPKYFDLDSNRSHGAGVTGCITTVPGMTSVAQDDTQVTSFTGIHQGRYST